MCCLAVYTFNSEVVLRIFVGLHRLKASMSLLGLTGELRVEERGGPLMHNLVKNMYTHIMHSCSLKSFMLTLQRFPVLVIGPGIMFYILSEPLFHPPLFCFLYIPSHTSLEILNDSASTLLI